MKQDKELGITKGEWKAKKLFDSTSHVVVSSPFTVATKVFEKEDAELIAEAGTIANQTGLTPKQLLEQRDQLLGLKNPYPLEDILDQLIGASNLLLHEKNYDGHAHEIIKEATEAAKEMFEVIKSIKQTEQSNYQT